MNRSYRAARPSVTGPASLLGVILLGGVATGYWIGSRNDPPRPTRAEPVAVAAVTPEPEPVADPAPPPAPEPAPPVQPKLKRPPLIPRLQKKFEPAAPKAPAKADPDAGEMMKEPAMKAEMADPDMKAPEVKPAPAPPTTKPAPAPATKPAAPEKSMKVVTFDQLKPLFKEKCLLCHGDPTIKGAYDMRTIKTIYKNRNGDTEVVPGNLDKSYLWDQVMNDSMPPDGKEKLTQAEKDLIRDWILSGAK